MSMSAITSYTRMEFRLLLREPLALFFTLVFPLLLLVIFGSIWGNTPIRDYGGYGYITLSLPGFLAMVVATSGILTLSSTVASYREIGFFRVLQTTPVTPFAVLSGQFASLFAATAASVAVLLIAARLVYNVAMPDNVLAFAAVFIGNCAALFSFGFLLASVLPSVRTTQIVSMGLFFPMLFLCGAAMPAAILPPGVREIGQFLPLTQAVNLFHSTWFGGEASAILRNVLALTVFTALNIAFASKAFSWGGESLSKASARLVSLGIYIGGWMLTVVVLQYA
jgi:ABC-2 type transport system permease protein